MTKDLVSKFKTIVAVRFILFLLLICWPLTISAEMIVESVVAEIKVSESEKKSRLVFLSDLKRYQLFFFQKKEDQEPPPLSLILEQVIFRKLLLSEATKFVTKAFQKDEVERKIGDIRNRFRDIASFEAALDTAALSEGELRGLVENFLRVQALLNERIREFIFISPRAVSTYYDRHAAVFPEIDRAKAEIEIRLKLRKEKEAKKISDYLERLHEKVEIEVFLK